MIAMGKYDKCYISEGNKNYIQCIYICSMQKNCQEKPSSNVEVTKTNIERKVEHFVRKNVLETMEMMHLQFCHPNENSRIAVNLEKSVTHNYKIVKSIISTSRIEIRVQCIIGPCSVRCTLF